MPAVSELRLRAWARATRPDVGREPDKGEEGTGMAGDPNSSWDKRGEPDKEPALKGWKETEGRRARLVPPSRFRRARGRAEVPAEVPAELPAELPEGMTMARFVLLLRWWW